MADEFEPWITEPGIYRDVSPEDYYRDPVVGGSLSSSTLRKVLPPNGCPAKAHHYHSNPGERSTSSAMEFGSAAHHLVLGETTKVVKMDVADWRTKAAKGKRAEHQAAGRIVIKAADWAKVEAMAEAIKADEWAHRLLGAGEPEVTVVWRDEATGIMLRGLIDRVDLTDYGRRALIFADYKTTGDASPEAAGRSVDSYGYHEQIELYRQGLQSVLPDREVTGILVFQETEPPYIVSVMGLDSVARRIAQARVRGSLDVWASCAESGHWPGYVQPPYELALPRWAEMREGIEL